MIFESFETISLGEIGAHATDWSRIACPYRKSNPHVLTVESTKHRPSFDTPVALNGRSIGRILP